MNPDITHTCAHCGHKWESTDYTTERGKVVKASKVAADVRTAAKVNKQGPFCDLCRHLEMAWRFATSQKKDFAPTIAQMIRWMKDSEK